MAEGQIRRAWQTIGLLDMCVAQEKRWQACLEMAATAEDAILDNTAIFNIDPIHQDTVQELHVIPNCAVCSNDAPLHCALLANLAALPNHTTRSDGGLGSNRHSLMAKVAFCVWLARQEFAYQLWASQFPAAKELSSMVASSLL